MRNYILCMFDSRNERSDFYFSAPESIVFPSCRFEKECIEKYSGEDDRWKNVGKLFEDTDVVSTSIFCRAEEYLIRPYFPKQIKF